MDKNTIHLLKMLLDTISETEMVIDQHRYDLCHNPQFAPYTAFCRLDQQNREHIGAHDMQNYFKQNGLSGIDIGECGRVIRTFDKDQDGLLTYEDFCNMVLVCKSKHLRQEAQFRCNSRVGRFEQLP